MSLDFPNSRLKRGSHAVICDRCGFRYHAEDLKKEWQGLMVCAKCYEPKHPQDLIKSVQDQKPKAFYRPEGQLVFPNTIITDNDL